MCIPSFSECEATKATRQPGCKSKTFPGGVTSIDVRTCACFIVSRFFVVMVILFLRHWQVSKVLTPRKRGSFFARQFFFLYIFTTCTMSATLVNYENMSFTVFRHRKDHLKFALTFTRGVAFITQCTNSEP